MEVPDDRHMWIKITMIPEATLKEFAQEKPNSTTRLLAATFTFKTLKRFGEGTTQCELQLLYQVRPKQLALCITGWKYWGGTDRKALVKKRKPTDDEAEPSTSKKSVAE